MFIATGYFIWAVGCLIFIEQLFWLSITNPAKRTCLNLHRVFHFHPAPFHQNCYYRNIGNGTLLIIKEMALQRNPGKTIAEIKAELKRTLGAKKIIWLKDGLAEDKVQKTSARSLKIILVGCQYACK